MVVRREEILKIRQEIFSIRKEFGGHVTIQVDDRPVLSKVGIFIRQKVSA